jgi:PPK2 family polyphosphate:nucleotide phosphotransferase
MPGLLADVNMQGHLDSYLRPPMTKKPLTSKATHRLDHAPFLVVPGKTFSLKDHDPAFTSGFKDKREAHKALLEDVSMLAEAQALLWASQEYAVVVILQAMDAAGKDGTIKHVMTGVNPQGVDVHGFKAPTEEELLHPFLWRATRAEPARGRIAIFNRSYYEEVLVVRVHPELLDNQKLPLRLLGKPLEEVWAARYEDIIAFERTWTRNNVVVLKFFLHVSRKEQRKRFLERLDNPEKHWKFSARDVEERRHWDDYMRAYEDMLRATSTEAAPWYVVPADRKWFTRACVADIITARIEGLKLSPPAVDEKDRAVLAEARARLRKEKE